MVPINICQKDKDLKEQNTRLYSDNLRLQNANLK